MSWKRYLLASLTAVLMAGSADVAAQEISGRVLDSANGAPVATAGVFLLSADRDRLEVTVADSLGRFLLEIPGGGEYYLFVQRLGYFETETPLLAVSDGGRYALDIELRPEPIRLDPLLVSVRNEELERWLTLELGGNPNAVFGYRAIQGLRLEEAKLASDDVTGMLRELFIPVSHGVEACLGSRMPAVERPSGLIAGAPSERRALELSEAPCGGLYVDDQPVPVEHLDGIDRATIAVVVVLPPNVRFYTRGFDWTMRRPARSR